MTRTISDRELLIRIDERVTELQKDVGSLCFKFNNIEKRVKKLEEWRMYIVGAIAILSALFAGIGKRILAFFLNE